jgi:hypothetical protein
MSITKDLDFDSRKKIFEEIKQFNRAEQEQLYRILRHNSEEVSENRNGIFFDLLSLKNETIDKIQTFIEFCVKNRQVFETREKEMSDLIQESLTVERSGERSGSERSSSA